VFRQHHVASIRVPALSGSHVAGVLEGRGAGAIDGDHGVDSAKVKVMSVVVPAVVSWQRDVRDRLGSVVAARVPVQNRLLRVGSAHPGQSIDLIAVVDHGEADDDVVSNGAAVVSGRLQANVEHLYLP
jgi:hypothetical protein